MMNKSLGLFILASLTSIAAFSQILVPDTIIRPIVDTNAIHIPPKEEALRITNISPYFNLHVDSTLKYTMAINKEQKDYYWYLKNPPVGVGINKDNGQLTIKAEKSLFRTGRLKFDEQYKVNVGVQNLNDPSIKLDTSFVIVFYNSEIIQSKLKPAVASSITIEEGETISFRLLCEVGSFPIEDILFSFDSPISDYTNVSRCNDEFKWTPPFDFIRETDKEKSKTITLIFIGSDKFSTKDTATVKITVKDALNYNAALEDYNNVRSEVSRYIKDLKYTFLVLDKRIRKTKRSRSGFEITSASTALSGTVLSSSSSESNKNAGKILPSVGVALVPVKEAAAPNRNTEQNQATLVRSSSKRLEYILSDNSLVGDKDLLITTKTNNLKDELRKTRQQLAEVPTEFAEGISETEMNRYFNSKKVNKKYRLK